MAERDDGGEVERVTLASATFLESNGFADTISQEVELGAANDARSLHDDLVDAWRVDGEFTFHTFTCNDTSYRERLVHAESSSGNHGSSENLDSFFFAFQNLRVNVDRIADVKLRRRFSEAALVDQFDKFLLVHGNFLRRKNDL